MYLQHIILWAAYYSTFVQCDVFNVTYEKTWDEANEYCKSKYNGTLSSVTEIQDLRKNETEHVWTKSSTLTEWLSYIGCFHITDKETKLTFDLNYDVTKRCSEGCGTSKFIGISAKRRCVCLSEDNISQRKTNWEDCHPPKNRSHYIVYRKYDIFTVANISAVLMTRTDLSDSTLNCGAVSCRLRIFFQENCKTELRFLCAQTRSRKRRDWTKGTQHCLKKDQPPQSFENYCQKSDGTFRNGGDFWIGMYRPLDHDNTPYKECTFWSNGEESANCTRSLPFFCTGNVAVEHPPTQSPTNPTSTIMSGGDMTGRNGHRKRPYFEVYIAVIVALCVILLIALVVVICLLRRTKRNAIKLQKQEPNPQVQMNRNEHSQEQEKALENIYDLIDADDENKKDNKLKTCRDLTVKCPVKPEMARSISQITGKSVSPSCDLPVFDGEERQDNICTGAAKADPSHQVSNSATQVDGHYDSFNSPRRDNDANSDTYDHAKVVNVSGRVLNLNPKSLPSDIDGQQPSKSDGKNGVYEIAKGVEHEYDEFKTPDNHVDTTDTYDHVILSVTP